MHASNGDVSVPVPPWSIDTSVLVKEQKADSTLKELVDMVCLPDEVRDHCQCYFLHKVLLMRN